MLDSDIKPHKKLRRCFFYMVSIYKITKCFVFICKMCDLYCTNEKEGKRFIDVKFYFRYFSD